jgi:hypothetical protein
MLCPGTCSDGEPGHPHVAVICHEKSVSGWQAAPRSPGAGQARAAAAATPGCAASAASTSASSTRAPAPRARVGAHARLGSGLGLRLGGPQSAEVRGVGGACSQAPASTHGWVLRRCGLRPCSTSAPPPTTLGRARQARRACMRPGRARPVSELATGALSRQLTRSGVPRSWHGAVLTPQCHGVRAPLR